MPSPAPKPEPTYESIEYAYLPLSHVNNLALNWSKIVQFGAEGWEICFGNEVGLVFKRKALNVPDPLPPPVKPPRASKIEATKIPANDPPPPDASS